MKVTSTTTLVTGSDEGPVEHKPGTPVDLPKKDAEDLIARGLAAAAGQVQAAPEPEPSGPELPLDVNAASAEDLAQVEHLNEDKAKAIVAHRDERGPFGSVSKTADDDGLTVVKGIGEPTAAKLADGFLVANQPEPININEATAEQLGEAIDGVADATAGDIVASRKAHGPFESLANCAERVGGVSLEQLEAADVTV